MPVFNILSNCPGCNCVALLTKSFNFRPTLTSPDFFFDYNSQFFGLTSNFFRFVGHNFHIDWDENGA
uniref:Uncharacterized protein n=1 Tax=Romanomermis culicivorax TaxID=13658 RepID=A0A915JQS9_ROMCU